MSDEPRRLLDDPAHRDAAVSALLRSARAYRPPEALRGRVVGRVLLGLGIGGAASGGVGAVAAATKFWIVVGTGLFAAGGGTYLALRPSAVAKPESAPRPHARPTAPASPIPEAPAEFSKPLITPPAPLIVARPAPKRLVRVSASSTPRESVTSPNADPAVLSSGQTTFETKQSRSSLSRELGYLDGARAALRAGNSRGALDQLDRHAREAPDGTLRLEAEMLRIEAFARLPDRAEVIRRAQRFVNAHPQSALADRARALLRTAETTAP